MLTWKDPLFFFNINQFFGNKKMKTVIESEALFWIHLDQVGNESQENI